MFPIRVSQWSRAYELRGPYELTPEEYLEINAFRHESNPVGNVTWIGKSNPSSSVCCHHFKYRDFQTYTQPTPHIISCH